MAAGIRLMYFSFDQHADKAAMQDGTRYGTVRDHLKGDNGMIDWGWEISSRYRITDKLTAGVMYKSLIDCKIKGENHTRVEKYDDSAIAGQVQKGVEAALNAAVPAAVTPAFKSFVKTLADNFENSRINQSLGNIGISVNAQGRLSVNEDKLSTALEDDSAQVNELVGRINKVINLAGYRSENLFPTIEEYADKNDFEDWEQLYSAKNPVTVDYSKSSSGKLLDFRH